MINDKTNETLFHEGDSVVLASGTYQGTRGVFLGLKGDPAWADIRETGGRVRSHPVVWMARVLAELPSRADAARAR